ncbi:MAG: YigZ family protein [Lachnospiraceae bacterium]|nr:YigZ family protein [Lachnospiraceae bacterium]
MPEGFKAVFSGGVGEIVEKKSRFIATIRPVETKEEAEEFFAEMKKKYWDARHNCFACVVGEKGEYVRSSDDGEPSGTAGKPMLEVLQKEEICNVAVVVTRYFGGTLLGTGGLVRAYQQAVKEGLKESIIVEKKHGRKLQATCDYNELGKLQYLLSQKGFPILDSIYQEKVTLFILLPKEQFESSKKSITETLNGKVEFEDLESVYYAEVLGKLRVFS